MDARADNRRDDTVRARRVAFRARADVFLRRHFPGLQYAVDALAWAVAIFVHDPAPLRPAHRPGRTSGASSSPSRSPIVYQAVVGLGLGLYRRRFHYGSLEEVRVLATTMAIVVRPALGHDPRHRRRLDRADVGAGAVRVRRPS